MSLNRNLFRRLMILALIVALCGAVAAYAGEVDDSNFRYLRNDDPAIVPVDIINFKAMLNKLGFYSGNANDSVLQTKELDDLTMAAVNLVCTLNPDLVFYNEGVTNDLYWRVMGEVDAELKTPLDEVYLEIPPGTDSGAVTRIQNRLNQLGYDMAGFAFTPGIYDSELQGAIDAFVECNKFIYNRESGITVELQELLFSDVAAAYVAPENTQTKLPFPDNVFNYLMAPVNVFGLEMSNIALWGAGFVLLSIIIVLILNLTGSDGVRKKKKMPERPINDPVKPGKIKPGKIEFTVEYNDETYIHCSDMKQYVRIGRTTGNFPLNTSDNSVSRKHCEIYNENGNLMLRDFSSYGTAINGIMCQHSQQMLHSGDVITVGDHKITVRFQKLTGGR